MTDIKNLSIPYDPFADAAKGSRDNNDSGGDVQQGLIHIRIQQRNGRKTLTTVQGVSDAYDFKKLAKALKKEFNCNGTVVMHPEHGEVIQLTGDQRTKVKDFLVSVGIATANLLKVHGF